MALPFYPKLYDEPELEFRNMNSAYNGIRENDFNEKFYLHGKWNTGFPFVDACMRQKKKSDTFVYIIVVRPVPR